MIHLIKTYFSIRNRLRVVGLKFQITWYKLRDRFAG